MKDSLKRCRLHAFARLLAVIGLVSANAAELSVISVEGRALRGNPLGDAIVRKAAVLAPDGTPPDRALPLVIYLPGWGGSPEEAIGNRSGSFSAQVVQHMADSGVPLRMVIVDGRSRYGGSQFLNSSATGNYSDYVVDDVVPEVEKKFATAGGHRVIAGHSSGGYGALMLAINRKDAFQAVVALSPDSDFETTHKPIVQESAVRAVTPAELEAAMAPPGKARLPKDGTAQLVLGLCANYTPQRGKAGRFDWLYDERGAWRQDVWQRWIDLDPLTVVRRDVNAFPGTFPVYLDGAQFDEFGANIGARKIEEALKARSQTVSFYESPGHHSDHLIERLERGLRWALSNLEKSAPSK